MENELEMLVEATEQLNALKKTLAEQQGSSSRLHNIAEALEGVVQQVSRLPSALSAIVARADGVEQRISSAAKGVEGLRSDIPAIVERIERSDVGRSIDRLTADISDSREDIKKFREVLAQVEGIFREFKASNEAVVKELSAELARSRVTYAAIDASIASLRVELGARFEGVERRIGSAEGSSSKGIEATGRAFELVTSAIKGSSERQSGSLQILQGQLDGLKGQELAQILLEIRSVAATLDQQKLTLEALAKKRGFSF